MVLMLPSTNWSEGSAWLNNMATRAKNRNIFKSQANTSSTHVPGLRWAIQSLLWIFLSKQLFLKSTFEKSWKKNIMNKFKVLMWMAIIID